MCEYNSEKDINEVLQAHEIFVDTSKGLKFQIYDIFKILNFFFIENIKKNRTNC